MSIYHLPWLPFLASLAGPVAAHLFARCATVNPNFVGSSLLYSALTVISIHLLCLSRANVPHKKPATCGFAVTEITRPVALMPNEFEVVIALLLVWYAGNFIISSCRCIACQQELDHTPNAAAG